MFWARLFLKLFFLFPQFHIKHNSFFWLLLLVCPLCPVGYQDWDKLLLPEFWTNCLQRSINFSCLRATGFTHDQINNLMRNRNCLQETQLIRYLVKMLKRLHPNQFCLFRGFYIISYSEKPVWDNGAMYRPLGNRNKYVLLNNKTAALFYRGPQKCLCA